MIRGFFNLNERIDLCIFRRVNEPNCNEIIAVYAAYVNPSRPKNNHLTDATDGETNRPTDRRILPLIESLRRD